MTLLVSGIRLGFLCQLVFCLSFALAACDVELYMIRASRIGSNKCNIVIKKLKKAAPHLLQLLITGSVVLATIVGGGSTMMPVFGWMMCQVSILLKCTCCSVLPNQYIDLLEARWTIVVHQGFILIIFTYLYNDNSNRSIILQTINERELLFLHWVKYSCGNVLLVVSENKMSISCQ